MKTRNKSSQWTLRVTFAVAFLALVAGLAFNPTDNTTVLADGNDLGTSPFDAVYRAHGILPENIVLRVGDASRTSDHSAVTRVQLHHQTTEEVQRRP